MTIVHYCGKFVAIPRRYPNHRMIIPTLKVDVIDGNTQWNGQLTGVIDWLAVQEIGVTVKLRVMLR